MKKIPNPFAKSKNIPTFAVLNITARRRDPAKIYWSGFFMPVHTGALIGTIKDSSSVPRGRLMAPQPGKVLSRGERNSFLFPHV